MIRECLWIPTLETERLFLRKLTANDADDLRKWFGLDIVYKYWGHPAGKGEKIPSFCLLTRAPTLSASPLMILYGVS